MTEFKKGDRVKVEYEGTVTNLYPQFGGSFDLNTGEHEIHVGARLLGKTTLLERPVEPLAPGSVVRSSDGDTWVVKRNGITYVPAAGEPFGSIESPESLARLVRDQSDFTLIHDGGKK